MFCFVFFLFHTDIIFLGHGLDMALWRPMQETLETQFWFLGREDPLEDGMGTHSSILAWRIPWTEKPGGYSPWGQTRLKWLSTHPWMLLTPGVCDTVSNRSVYFQGRCGWEKWQVCDLVCLSVGRERVSFPLELSDVLSPSLGLTGHLEPPATVMPAGAFTVVHLCRFSLLGWGCLEVRGLIFPSLCSPHPAQSLAHKGA